MLGNLGYQYAIRSYDAYQCLKRLPNKLVPKNGWYPRYKYRRNMARQQYNDVKIFHGRSAINEVFFTQIINDNIKPEDQVVTFPRQVLEEDNNIDNLIFEETDNLANNGIYPGA